MPLTTTQAQQELFTLNFTPWRAAIPMRNRSNAPHGCSEINERTAANLRRQWNPNSRPNSWNQSSGVGSHRHNNITRWVTRSVSGGSDVVDFHALFNSTRFLWHFKIV
ncbi:hypothetical protein [Paraburkholderia bannensis]|uniref:hypothetical protein n=1 Tax=Paraburkholderia bannensis TaxID=765414 RepID=UPI0004888DDB|nr:hypothetical protein [Paraburkholderia bannensis]